MNSNEIVINGDTYVKKSAATGKRAIVVVDRGWVFAGDVTDENGRIYLDNAVHVFSWANGFPQLVADPKKAKADLRIIETRVDIPKDGEIFRVPVSDTWGK